MTHINASYVRSHFDAMEVGVPGAPARDEIVLALVMTTGARVHARVGGLRAEEITGRGWAPMKAKIRKLITVVDEIHREMGRAISPPTRRAVAAGGDRESARRPVSRTTSPSSWRSARNLAACSPSNAWRRSASRAARPRATARRRSSAEAGELEHAAAILHPKMGTPVRKVLSKGAGAHPVGQEDGRTRHGHRRAARAQGCGLSCARTSTPSKSGSPTRRAQREIVVAIAVTDQRPAARPHRRIGQNTRSRAKTGCGR